MSLLAFPSAFALAIKLWGFYYVRQILLQRDNRALVCFLLALFCLNLVELISFNYLDQPETALPLLLLYYVAALFSVSSFIGLSAKLAQLRFINPFRIQHLIAAVLALMLLGSDRFVAGVQSLGYSLTRVPGEAYGLLVGYIVTGFIFGMVVLLIGALRLDDPVQRKRCAVLFFAFLPTVLAVITVVALMQYGIRINATLILPLTISVFLVVLIYSEDQYDLFCLLSRVPGTEERRLHLICARALEPALAKAFQHPSRETVARVVKAAERSMITAVLEKYQEDIGRTATHLMITREG